MVHADGAPIHIMGGTHSRAERRRIRQACASLCQQTDELANDCAQFDADFAKARAAIDAQLKKLSDRVENMALHHQGQLAHLHAAHTKILLQLEELDRVVGQD